MKKLMIAACAATMVCVCAQAAKSFDYDCDIAIKAYEAKDATPCEANASWYSGYVLKQEDAKTLLGSAEAVTYQDVAKWLGSNYSANQSEVISMGMTEGPSTYSSEYDSYIIANNYDHGSNEGEALFDAIGVFFFDNGKGDLAYQTMQNRAPHLYLMFNDEDAQTTGWVAVPEPTSGLLMLLGLAGLALKRKRA